MVVTPPSILARSCCSSIAPLLALARRRTTHASPGGQATASGSTPSGKSTCATARQRASGASASVAERSPSASSAEGMSRGQEPSRSSVFRSARAGGHRLGSAREPIAIPVPHGTDPRSGNGRGIRKARTRGCRAPNVEVGMLQQRAVLAAASKMCWYIFALHACATTFTCGCLHLPPRHPLPNAQTHERGTEEHQLALKAVCRDCRDRGEFEPALT
jgi:hypothetical protein